MEYQLQQYNEGYIYRWNFISNKKSMEDGKKIDRSMDVSFIIRPTYYIKFYSSVK